MRTSMYVLLIIAVIATCIVYAEENATITINNYRLGAEISGKVPGSARCGEATLKEVVLGAGPNKGKKVKVVSISHDTKGLWLGVTALIDGSEKDFPAEVVTGNFKKSYSVFDDVSNNPAATVEFVACLWTTKWSSEACAFENGKKCSYCENNGYHMDGEVVRERK